jgi:hypothetical protein
MKTKPLVCSLFLSLSVSLLLAQGDCNELNLQLHADLPSDCAHMTMTMLHDQEGRPFLYVAGKEGGLRVYSLDNLDQPQLVASLPVTEWENLDVMNLSQDGENLYLALGNHFSQNQQGGMAIIDMADPTEPMVTDYWVFPELYGGAGIVQVAGNFAYLGAMKHGLVILDVSDKSDITFVSLFQPDIYYPDPNPDPDKFNARGLTVRDHKVYLCYDAGGLRIIDVQDPTQPEEIGRYANPALNGKPRAYNNIVLDDDLAYIATDCNGMEILNIADPDNITLISWWNPWHCDDNPLNWFFSPGHANEIFLNRDCHWVFLSTGKSDMYVVDVSNPAAPDSCHIYGGIDNGIGTWGVSSYADRIFLSYVCAAIPFGSDWTGVKVLTYNNPCLEAVEDLDPVSWQVYPNPAADHIFVTSNDITKPALVQVSDALGNRLLQFTSEGNVSEVDVSKWPGGMYFVLVIQGDMRFVRSLVKI